MKVRDILKDKGTEVATIGAEKTICDAVKALVEKNIGSLLVKDEKGAIAGIVTERDILKQCNLCLESFKETKVKDVMTKNLIVASPDDDLDYVENIMTQNRVRHLPIISNQKLEGIISIGDLVNVLRGECKVENRYLKNYISGKYPG
ncbi:MAG: CBS domain-containing protein [candidate division Zixibacteria bacterium]|nr:CBS domain-containing protein [candidate division Zixibacteria bacterium]